MIAIAYILFRPHSSPTNRSRSPKGRGMRVYMATNAELEFGKLGNFLGFFSDDIE